MKKHCKLLLMTISLLLPIDQSRGGENESWYLVPTLGLSQIADFSVTSKTVFGANGDAAISVDSGLLADLVQGYEFNQAWVTKVAWECRVSDREVVLTNGVACSNGNYVSSRFMLIGRYSFESAGKWNSLICGGVLWTWEIDIDLESLDNEFSYSSDGDLGLQFFAGSGYQLSDRMELEGSLRYSTIASIDLEAESRANRAFANVDYKPISAQVSLNFDF